MDLVPLSRKELAAALIELHDDANRSIGNKWWSTDALAAFLVRKHDLQEVNKKQIKLALNDIKAGLHGDIKLATEMKSMAYPDPDVATPAATGDNASVVAATEANSTESKEDEAVNNKKEEPAKKKRQRKQPLEMTKATTPKEGRRRNNGREAGRSRIQPPKSR